MDYSSKILTQAVEQIATLPGIGHKTALRMALHLLGQPISQVHTLSEALTDLVDNIKHCNHCHNLSDEPVCQICANDSRDRSVICVVEDIRDVIAIEQTNLFSGVYHVLGGRISPMDGVGPSDLQINSLIGRLAEENIKELIFAMSATIEGDTTAYYIYKKIPSEGIILSCISRGVSIGGELQHTDNVTLGRSIQNRTPYKVN